jgi:hypothetical protein
MESISPRHPLRRLFTGLVENAFCAEVGMCDPRLTDYMTDLLVSFTHIERFNAIRNAAGKELDQIAAVLASTYDEQPKSKLDRDRMVYRNIGDFTLFWAGVYPEQLKLIRRDPTDVLVDYVTQGKRSYAIVSKLAGENDAPPSSLFRHLSDDFEFCLHGLGLVRRGLEETLISGRDSGEILY